MCSLDSQWRKFSLLSSKLSHTLRLLRSTSRQSFIDPWPCLSLRVLTPHPFLVLTLCQVNVRGGCRNRFGGGRQCVACNYRSLAGPVAVMCNSQIKVQPEDLAGHTAALCYLIAGSWVSHVKWQGWEMWNPQIKHRALKSHETPVMRKVMGFGVGMYLAVREWPTVSLVHIYFLPCVYSIYEKKGWLF